MEGTLNIRKSDTEMSVREISERKSGISAETSAL